MKNYKSPKICARCEYSFSNYPNVFSVPETESEHFCNVKKDAPTEPVVDWKKFHADSDEWRKENKIDYFGTCDNFKERKSR